MDDIEKIYRHLILYEKNSVFHIDYVLKGYLSQFLLWYGGIVFYSLLLKVGILLVYFPKHLGILDAFFPLSFF